MISQEDEAEKGKSDEYFNEEALEDSMKYEEVEL